MQEECSTCQPLIRCCSGGNPFAYSVTGGVLISSDQTGFVFQCPIGFSCLPGAYPMEVIIPRGSVQYRLTYFPGSGPLPPIIVPCPGGDIVLHIPLNATLAQIQELAKKAVAGCVKQKAKIIATPKNPSFRVYNSPQSLGLCEGDETLSGHISGPYSISGNTVTISSGVVGVTCGDTSPAGVSACQAQANSLAAEKLFNDVQSALDSGDLVCAPPSDLNFNDLSNPIYQPFNISGGTSSGNQTGNVLTSQTNAIAATGFSIGNMVVTATLLYSGVAVAGNIHVSITAVNLGVANSGGQCANNIVTVGLDSSLWGSIATQAFTVPGDYDIPFNIPAGDNQTITAGIGNCVGRTSGSHQASSASITATFTPAM